MFLSIFDLFKINVGPSSSHTMGPILAAGRFAALAASAALPAGRLAFACGSTVRLPIRTRGRHRARRAVRTDGHAYDSEQARAALDDLAQTKRVRLGNGRMAGLDPATAVALEKAGRLPARPNGMTFALTADGADVLAESYYSVGGGFVLTAAEMEAGPARRADPQPSVQHGARDCAGASAGDDVRSDPRAGAGAVHRT